MGKLLDNKESSVKWSIWITPMYEKKIENLRKELYKSKTAMGMELIDVVFADNADAIAMIRRHITRRIQAGVGQAYMVQLSLLHKVLTIFLKRTGYL